MKKINPVNVDNYQKLQDLINNDDLKYYGVINQEYFIICDQYEKYLKCSGFLFDLTPQVREGVVNVLKYYYDNPPKSLSFISKIRNQLSPDICPMCGGFGPSEVDHYLPRSDYPDWSIFSLNLVPACDCNKKRSTRTFNNDKRVLHPYYDDLLKTRIISCQFTGDLSSPQIDIVPIVNDANVQYHIDTVVKRERLSWWMRKSWANLKRSPSIVINELDKSVLVDKSSVSDAIKTCLRNKDLEFETPNNWSSIFLHGLLSSNRVIEWVVQRHNDILNGTIDLIAD